MPDAELDDAQMPDLDGGPPVDGGPVPTSCVSPSGADPSGTASWDDALGRATVEISDRDACQRAYTLTTTATLRHGEPGNPRTVIEQAGAPTVRTGHDFFDALHALALAEVRECSVDQIRDGAFNSGAGVPCGEGGCFETGRLWNYVWTRDTAYAVDLGLAGMDPTRSLNSLSFKLSERRGGGDLQIVQDTGSGGSYPISTDRVAWAVGAWELLRHLHGATRDAFAARAYEAVSNTIDHDREVAFDPEDGLYRGEQSFLDWREQTYPEWTATDVVHLGMSKSLGTNLLHLRAIELAAFLADERGEASERTRFAGYAADLREAISERFWLEEEGQFSTFVTTSLDPAPVRRYDALASAFAVLFDVATEAQAERILESYPHYGPGVPVIWPQQQQTPIYHNRGEWPFVTAYWLRAAKHANNDAVAAKMIRALMRGAAINLSNMENFEASSGAAWVEEGATSGPVVNSQRQLWSVAGYLSMVHHTLFGLEATDEGLRVSPYVPASLRSSLFAGTDELVLNDYPYRGRRITVVLRLPESAGTGALRIASRRLNGAALSGEVIDEAMLGAENRLDVVLEAGTDPSATITETTDAQWRNVFGPRTPRITALAAVGGRVQLTLSTTEAADVRLRVYRDGAVVADDLPGTTTTWMDTSFDAGSARTPCYVVEATFSSSGNHSQHSPPACWWGAGFSRITTFGASAMTNVGGTGVTNHGRFHYENWGDAGHSLTTPSFTATQTGEHWLQLTYGNGAGAINTGITCAVKRVVVTDATSGAEVGDGIVMMPHLGTWSTWADSSFVRVRLEAGRSYRFVIRGDDRAVNMSSFAHFEAYTGGTGGSSGTFNRVNVAELKVLAR